MPLQANIPLLISLHLYITYDAYVKITLLDAVGAIWAFWWDWKPAAEDFMLFM